MLQAHRSHAYQWLARRWHSHGKVTAAVLGVNIAWLLPWAAWSARRPDSAALYAVIAMLPLAALALACGAGRGETGAVQ